MLSKTKEYNKLILKRRRSRKEDEEQHRKRKRSEKEDEIPGGLLGCQAPGPTREISLGLTSKEPADEALDQQSLTEKDGKDLKDEG